MKSEERHELQQNDLASWVYTAPILIKQYGSYILLALSCCVLAYMLWDRHVRNQQVAIQNAWNELAQASDESSEDPPRKLRAITNTYDNRAVQAEAYRRLGKFYLQTVLAGNPPEGLRGVKITRDDALLEAEKALKKVTTEFADLPTAVAAATLDLGAVEESRRDWDAAKKYYETLTAKSGPFAATAFATEAQYRLDNLDKYKTPIAFGPPAKPVTTAPASRPTTAPASLESLLQGLPPK